MRWLTRRWYLWLLLTLGAGSVFLLIVLSDPDPIDQAHCDLIKPEMTMAEVEAILGGKSTGGLRLGPWPDYEWEGAKGRILIWFHPDSPRRVIVAEFLPDNRPVWQKVRRRLELRAKKFSADHERLIQALGFSLILPLTSAT